MKIKLLITLFFISMFPQQGHWELLNAKENIISRSECGMAAVDGNLFLIGGDGGEVQPVEVYDPATNTWTEKSEAPIIMHHFEAVGYNHKVYILDAFDKGNFPDQDPMPGGWKKGAELPPGRRRAGVALHNGKLYLVDGIKHGHSSGTTNLFDEYDPVADRWDSLTDAPHIRDH